MPKKKTKEVKEVVPFQISNVKNYNVWFIQCGWKVYKRIMPLPYKYVFSLKALKKSLSR